MKQQLPERSAYLNSSLKAFQEEAMRVYGHNLQSVILFGSYARGDFHAGSDVDLLLLFDEKIRDRVKENQIYDKIIDLVLEKGIVISLASATKRLFDTKKTPLYLNIRREGVELWKQS